DQYSISTYMTTPADNLNSPAQFLEMAYKHLEFEQGALLPAIKQPDTQGLRDWLDRGDWQTLAAQVGAEKIFFVDRDPVVVFAKAENNSQEILRKIYERIWCMSRPQMLFLATPGQLTVFDLTKPPPSSSEKLDDRNRLIDRVTSIADVQ